MWIFTLDGYFSAVMNRNDPDEIMVRSRKRQDLERLLARLGRQDLEILAWAGSDYAYRVFMMRKTWTRYLIKMSEELTYTNFKAAAIPPGDHDRSSAYHAVWSRLARWQDREHGIGGGGPQLFEDYDYPDSEWEEAQIWPLVEEDDPDSWLRNYWIK